jgi:integrase
VRDVDLDNGHMRFFEKGGKVIWKPMPDELAALVSEAIDAGIIGSRPEDYVIPMAGKQRRAEERDDRVVYYLVKKISKRAGVEAHVHALRAAFAVKYLEANPGRLLELKAHGPPQPGDDPDLPSTARSSTVDGNRPTTLLGRAVLSYR